MEKFKEIAYITGKPGLFRIVKPTRTGVIVETIDAKKEKTVISGNSKVSVLNEISVFMSDHQESAKPLPEIMQVLVKKHPNGLQTPVKELSEKNLIELFLEIEPEFDRDRVYPSDIKKIFNWYEILRLQWPDALQATETVAEQAEEKEEVKLEAKPAKKTKKA
jgi:hypothetical protein